MGVDILKETKSGRQAAKSTMEVRQKTNFYWGICKDFSKDTGLKISLEEEVRFRVVTRDISGRGNSFSKSRKIESRAWFGLPMELHTF